MPDGVFSANDLENLASSFQHLGILAYHAEEVAMRKNEIGLRRYFFSLAKSVSRGEMTPKIAVEEFWIVIYLLSGKTNLKRLELTGDGH